MVEEYPGEKGEIADFDYDDDDDDARDGKSSSGIIRTSADALRRVQRELCLIRLCWPEVAADRDHLYARSLPDAYRRVSGKERLLLWYAENFRRQFCARYPDRRPLLLAGENECGVQVSVGDDSSSILIRRPRARKMLLSPPSPAALLFASAQ